MALSARTSRTVSQQDGRNRLGNICQTFYMTRYDIWKTASPPEYDLECCDECFVTSHDVPTEFGERAVPEGCGDEDCICHATDDGDAAYDAMRDDQLTD